MRLPSQHWPRSTHHIPLTSLDPSTSEDPLSSFLIALGEVLYPASLALALKKQLGGKTDQERPLYTDTPPKQVTWPYLSNHLL